MCATRLWASLLCAPRKPLFFPSSPPLLPPFSPLAEKSLPHFPFWIMYLYRSILVYVLPLSEHLFSAGAHHLYIRVNIYPVTLVVGI